MNQIAQVEVTPSSHIVVIGVRTSTDKALVFVPPFLTICELYPMVAVDHVDAQTQNENVRLYGPSLISLARLGSCPK